MNLLLLRMGNSVTEVLYTFTKTEILLQILKKIKVNFKAYGQCSQVQILIIPLTFRRNLFSVTDGKCILLQTGNFHRKWRFISVHKTLNFLRGQN